MKSSYERNKEGIKRFLRKNADINKALKFDYSKLVLENEYFGEKKSFLIGSNIPLKSFSSLVRGLNMSRYENIPQKNLNIVRELGSDFMINLEHYFLTNDVLINNNEKLEALHNNFLEYLSINNYEIKAVEKYFVCEKTNSHAYLDVIVWDKRQKRNILLEIKTRGHKNKKIDNITLAQARFYKNMFFHIPTKILILNRDFDLKAKEKSKWWNYEEYEVINETTEMLRIINAYNDVDNWNLYYGLKKKKTL